jgi:hypothetical protein
MYVVKHFVKMLSYLKNKVQHWENVFEIIITFICKKDFLNFNLIIYLFSLVDNLPCATKFQNVDTHEVMYEHGYRLGMYTKQVDDIYINNHLIIKLFYHKESE